MHRTAERMTAAGEIAPMVIAMPSDGLSRDGSGYLNWRSEQVESWIVDEVPALAQQAVAALLPEAPVAIGGLSMGGYGALRLGAKYAARFCAISAHSAITDISDFAQFLEESMTEYLETAPREEISVFHWLRSAGERLPPLRFDCGVDDSLIESNRTLHDALQREHIAHTYIEHDGGHEWTYWQRHVAETLRFADQHFRSARHA